MFQKVFDVNINEKRCKTLKSRKIKQKTLEVYKRKENKKFSFLFLLVFDYFFRIELPYGCSLLPKTESN